MREPGSRSRASEPGSRSRASELGSRSRASEPLLAVEHAAVDYGSHRAIEVEALEVARGQVLTLMGANGSGKSTLLRLLSLVARPAQGSVQFEGRVVDWSDRKALLAARRRMASVLQQPLLCRMSVRQNVALGLRFRGLRRREIDRRVGPWLERLRIDALAERPAHTLSGGEAQRASLARALVLEPEVLFLDEPFAALDAPTRATLLDDLQAVLREAGVTTVFATHARTEALALGDCVAVLLAGRVAQVGSAEAVFSRPESEVVARFVGVGTLLPGRVRAVEAGVVAVTGDGFEVEVAGNAAPGDEVLVSVRPEEITVFAADAPAGGSARNRFEGRVAKVVQADAYVRVEIDCGFPLVALVTRPSFRELGIEPGRPLRATFKATAAHLIRRGPAAI